MRSFFIVVTYPIHNKFSCFNQIAEDMPVKTFLPHFTIETLDKAILRWLSFSYETQLNSSLVCPFEHNFAGKLGTVITFNCLGCK